MLRVTFKSIVLTAVALTVVVSMIAPAIADTTIYSDTFTREGSLNGSAPEIQLGSTAEAPLPLGLLGTHGRFRRAQTTPRRPTLLSLPLCRSYRRPVRSTLCRQP